MRKYVLLLAVLGLAASGFSQGVRFDPFPASTSATAFPGGAYPPLLVIPGTIVTLCNYPALNAPCTNLATTYTDPTLAYACPTGKPVVWNGSTSCVSTADNQGRFGFWLAAGNYAYMLTNPANGVITGPFAFTAGGSGGGTTTPGGSPGSLQYNFGGTSFGGFSGSCIPKLNGSSAPGCAVAGTDYLQSITASQITTLLQALSGCSTAGNPYMPATGTCVAVSGLGTVTNVSGATSGGLAVSVTNQTTTPVVSAAAASGYYIPTSADQTNWNAKQAALGYTPLNPANNLGDVAVAATALSNLGGVPSTRTVNGHALSANVTVTSTDVGLSAVTNDAQTKAAIVPNTAPSAGQIYVGNAGGTAMAVVTVSADCTLASTGAITCTKTNGTPFVASATTDTTNATNIASGTLASGRLPAALANSTSVNGTPIPASGTLMQTTTAVAAGQMPALTGDCTSTVGTVGTTCTKTSGTPFGSLATLSAVPVSPLTINASAGPVTVSGNTGYWFNNFGAMTYSLPTITSGLVGAQYCFRNYTAITGVLTLQLPASTYVDRNGAIGTVAGHLASAGALGDSACVVAISTTRYAAYIQSGTWVNP